MRHINFEFKAKTNCIAVLEDKLLKLNPQFIGVDFQKDTYFNVPSGRLKLREGNIENVLIFYQRNEEQETKTSNVILYPHTSDDSLKDILNTVHNVKVIVNKKRKIYFIDNVKFHFDSVDELGDFIEVEAIEREGVTITQLKEQCDFYKKYFNILPSEFISESYSDLILGLNILL